MNRWHLAYRYASGSRLEEYRAVVTTALRQGYTVCSVEQSLNELKAGTNRIFVLRHDVDQVSPGVRAMASMEASCGVTASYYFRLSTLDQNDVEHARSLGHEVSYHYETIADYALRNGIVDRESMLLAENMKACARELEQELQAFRHSVQAPCRTLASHGAPRNRELRLPNRVLFERIDGLHDRLGVSVEAYDKDYLRQFDAYISDTQMEINDGYRYGVNPLTSFATNTPRIVFLSHPHHWAFSSRTRLRRVIKCLLLGPQKDSGGFAEADRLRLRDIQR